MSEPLSLSALGAEQARSITCVAFDLDDTVLDHGLLGLEAFTALHALSRAGVELVATTGRPSGFAEIVARQWPVSAAVGENGAVAWERSASGRVIVSDDLSNESRAERRAKLLEIASAVRAAFPDIDLADDDWARRTDVALDIGEHRRVAADVVARARSLAESMGARTFTSSVHLHVTFDAADKASGFAALAKRRGRDPAAALASAAFVGDSPNDAAAFAAFGVTFGVANVRAHLAALPVPPRYISSAPMGRGFAEVADRILALRV